MGNHETLETHKKEDREIIHRVESHALLGARFEVYKEMGNGFLEAVHQE